jgi:hypothetical protein
LAWSSASSSVVATLMNWGSDLSSYPRAARARPVSSLRRTAASRGRACARTPLTSRIRTGRSRTDGRTRRRDGERGDGSRGSARAWPLPRAQAPSGGGRSGNAIGTTRSDRERQVMRDPSTRARLTGSLLSAAGAR